MEWLHWIHRPSESAAPSPAVPTPGDEVRVWFKILEQGKERLGQFEGTVLRLRGSGVSKTFTVRRITYGEGVERVFPLDAKIISKIEILRQGRVHRSRLYFLRRAIGKTRLSSIETPKTNPLTGRSAAGSPATPTTPAEQPVDKPAASHANA